MDRKPPAPVCKAFLICRQIVGETLTLIGKSNCHLSRQFPSSCPLAFFARLTGGHGQYYAGMKDSQGCVAAAYWTQCCWK